jgi:hypothetical protein
MGTETRDYRAKKNDADGAQCHESPNAQAQRSAAWMPYSEGTLSFRLGPSLLSEATAACALQLVVRRRLDSNLASINCVDYPTERAAYFALDIRLKQLKYSVRVTHRYTVHERDDLPRASSLGTLSVRLRSRIVNPNQIEAMLSEGQACLSVSSRL